ncbi:MAG: Reeler domain-containing protein [Bacteroidota bacterium]|nr:Reeler domain-containing protein [Bacteroidota bacterium]
MKNKIILSGLVLVAGLIIAASPERSSSGAPPSHAGAPGEESCAASGCHDDNSTNSGTASLTIDAGTVTNYVPGQTYVINVKITDPGVNRFGFQLVALDNTSMNAGTFSIADPARTQLVKNHLMLTDRQYVTYSFQGTDITSPGASVWSVNWTAPATAAGPVSFFAAGVSANDDTTDDGDFVYTTSLVITN